MPDALGPFVDALEIAALLAVKLRQRDDDLDGSASRVGMAEQVGALDVEPGSARKMDIVAAVDADDANVLAGGFRAIALGSLKPPVSAWPASTSPT